MKTHGAVQARIAACLGGVLLASLLMVGQMVPVASFAQEAEDVAAQEQEAAGDEVSSQEPQLDADLLELVESLTYEELLLLSDEVGVRIEELAPAEELPEVSRDLPVMADGAMTLMASFVYDNDVYVAVRNNTDQAILDFTVAYTHFDKSGLPATRDRDGYELGSASAANILPGQTSIFSWYGADGDYIDATVTSVTFRDGTTWQMKDVAAWADESNASFDIAKRRVLVDAHAENAQKAMEEGPIGFSIGGLVERNMFSTEKDFDFNLANHSELGLTEVRIFTLQYDANWYPVVVSPYDTYCKHGRTTGGTVNLAPGDWSVFTDDLFAESSTQFVVACVISGTYADGTTWENPYFYDWLAYYVG